MASGAAHGKKHAAATRDHVPILGAVLTVQQVASVARAHAPVQLSAQGRKRAEQAHLAVRNAAKQRSVYAQSTGVGSNKDTPVFGTDAADHGLRLLRSHAASAGPLLDTEFVRAMMVVRLNQLAVGGAGVRVAVLEALETALNRGLTPPVTKYGAIGTGDLTALATTMLCMIGECAWQDGSMPILMLDSTDAMAFMSSSAATLGEAALASADISQLLQAGLTVGALSFLALGGSAEALGETVHHARPHEGQIAAALALRQLLGVEQLSRESRRLQDPYCLRALPQVHGAALDAAGRLEQVLHIEMNAASENPFIDTVSGDIFHNGNFHGVYVSLALDNLRAAVYQTASLAVARISSLMEPALTTLRPFLAYGPAASSGTLIAEYVAQSALAELRHVAAADSLGAAVVSRGAEEHASFATQAAWHTTEAVAAYETILACECIMAVRALTQLNAVLPEGPLSAVYKQAIKRFDADMSDRPLDADLAAARELLRSL